MLTDHERRLVEALASHLPGARVDGRDVVVGALAIRPWIHSLVPADRLPAAANLMFRVGGDAVGQPIELAYGGAGADEDEAVAAGARAWASSYGAVLVAALSGQGGDGEPAETTIDGRRWRLHVGGFVRGIVPGEHATARAAEAEQRFPSAWMLPAVIAAGCLPPLPPGQPVILDVRLWDHPELRSVTLRVDGRLHPPAEELVAARLDAPLDPYVELREIAVLTPPAWRHAPRPRPTPPPPGLLARVARWWRR